MTARVRPITVMAAAALVAVVLVAGFALTRDDDAVVGQPAALPILIGARAEAALAPVSTVGSRTYVRGPGLADPGGPVAAWSVVTAQPDPAEVRRLADAFGVSGDLRKIDGGWQIGADGEAAVRVAELPGSRWDYAPGGPPVASTSCVAPTVETTIPFAESTTTSTTSTGSASTGSASTSASDPALAAPHPGTPEPSGTSSPDSPSRSDDVGVDGCTSTPAPESVPTADEAEAATRDLLHRAGLDVAHLRLSATSGAWGAQVNAVPELDGTPAFGLDTVVSFGADAAITSASGWLLHPTQQDDYPLIGIDAAIDRVNAGRDLLDGFVPMPLVGMAVDDASTSGSAASGSGSAVSSGAYPPITGPPTTVTTPASATNWDCGVPLPPPAADGEESSGGGPSTTTTVVGVGAGDAGGSTGSGASCPGSVCPAPPCPSGEACAYACAVPTCDPAACTDPYPGPTVVPEPIDPPTDLPADLPETGPVVTVTSVEVVLAAVPGSDGSLWLVPAYRLIGDDGGTITVLGVDESFVAPPSATPGSSATVATEIAPLPEPAQEPATDPTAAAPASAVDTPCTAPWMC